MSKEEKIIEAYGSDWDRISIMAKKCAIENNGWISMILQNCPNTDIMDFFDGAYRPKFLQGIEYNNGWIKIESEEDLPKDNINCYFILKSNKAILPGKYSKSGVFDYALRYYDLNDVTHYQPITKPQPPIY